MSGNVQIGRASEDEIAYFAAHRWKDDMGRRLYQHLGAQSPDGAWVARDDGSPVGIAFTRGYEQTRYQSELFVEPSFRGTGLGGALLDAGATDASEGIGALIDPLDFAATALCMKRGSAPRVSVLRVVGGIPKEEALAAIAFGSYRFRAVPLDPYAHRYALAALDRETRGFERGDDHTLFASIACGHAIFLDEECVGYSYAWPDGRVGPMAYASNVYGAPIFAFTLMTLTSRYGASWCSAGIPGANVRALEAARRLGLRIDMVRIYADAAGMEGDLSRYVGYHPLLF